MNKNDSNPCFPFDQGAGEASAPFNFAEASLSAIIKELQSIETIEDFLPLSMAMDKQEDLYVLVRDLSLNHIKNHRLYLNENCTSIYDFCERQRGNAFAVSRGTVQNSLDIADTLYELSGFSKRASINDYLKNEGKSEGRGVPSDDATRLEFRLSDFAGHASKLALLKKLMDKVEYDIDWHEFFTDGYDDYEAYAYAILYPKKEEQQQSADEIIDHFNNPFRRGGNPPTKEVEPQAESETIKTLDPFSPAANGPSTMPDEVIGMGRTTHHFDPINFDKLPVGTLAGHPIFGETELYSDPGYEDRALAFMRKELA